MSNVRLWQGSINIASEQILAAKKVCRLSASIGVAELTPSESLDELLIRIDNARYDAKGRGENGIAVVA